MCCCDEDVCIRWSWWARWGLASPASSAPSSGWLWWGCVCQVELVGPVGPRLARLLSPLIRVAAAAPSDEVHLILEYDVGEGWGGATAPVASRFITSHDDANGDASSLELLFETVRAARPSPDLIVFSGETARNYLKYWNFFLFARSILQKAGRLILFLHARDQ